MLHQYPYYIIYISSLLRYLAFNNFFFVVHLCASLKIVLQVIIKKKKKNNNKFSGKINEYEITKCFFFRFEGVASEFQGTCTGSMKTKIKICSQYEFNCKKLFKFRFHRNGTGAQKT